MSKILCCLLLRVNIISGIWGHTFKVTANACGMNWYLVYILRREMYSDTKGVKLGWGSIHYNLPTTKSDIKILHFVMVPRQEKGNLAPNKIIIAHLYCDLNLHVCVTFRFDGCQHVYQNNSNNRTKKMLKLTSL